MSWRYFLLRVGLPALVLALLLGAWRAWGWPGLAAVSGGLLMWLLLHVTRTMQVLQRAAQRPLGHVDSAVMLNSQLQVGQSLLQVITRTRALGQRMSEAQAQPEIFRWQDAGGSAVVAEFVQGRLQSWRLDRPAAGAP